MRAASTRALAPSAARSASTKAEHVGAQLVRASRPALLRQQAGQAGLRKRGLRLIKGRTRKAEGLGGRGDGRAIDLDAAQHLVLDLHGIPSVEEGLLIEEGIPHGVRVRMQRALGAQRRCFAVWAPGHCVV